MKRLLFLMIAAAAAAAILVALTVPARRLTLNAQADGSIPGILHVHTNRSDGLSEPDEIAAAAARAGLKFLVFTDHGDGTRTPDRPTYRSGVLCLDGVEISTAGGHYVAIDMPAAPYPLGGDPRGVVEDVKRLGGFGIVAHPDSPKPELRWRDWTAPFDGVELLNLDTSWRVLAQQAGLASKWQLFVALVDYPFRAPEAMANLIQPSTAVERWEVLTRRRSVVVTAGADAHSRLALGGTEPANGGFALPLPGYESTFRALSVHVRPNRPLSGNASEDAAAIVGGIRAGHLYYAVDGIASPPAFEFTATNSRGTVNEGDELGLGGNVLLRVRSNAPPSFTTIVHDGTQTVTTVRDAQDLRVHAPEKPGVYWVEIVSTGRGRPVTWIRSNPIYVRAPAPAERPPARPPAARSLPLFDGRTNAQWTVETDPTSLAAFEVSARPGGFELRLRYGLSGGSRAGRFAALVAESSNGTASYDRLTFTARAERPMRISVQLRAGENERWQRSVYVDTFNQEQTIYFDDLTPVGPDATARLPLDRIRSVLFVVDTVNTKPGSSGRLWISSAALQHP